MKVFQTAANLHRQHKLLLLKTAPSPCTQQALSVPHLAVVPRLWSKDWRWGHACWQLVDSWQASWSWLTSHCFSRPLRCFIPEVWKIKSREANTGEEAAKQMWDRNTCRDNGRNGVDRRGNESKPLNWPLSYNTYTVTTFVKLLPYMVTHYFAAAAVPVEI